MKNLALWVAEVQEVGEAQDGVEGELQKEVVKGLRASFVLM